MSCTYHSAIKKLRYVDDVTVSRSDVITRLTTRTEMMALRWRHWSPLRLMSIWRSPICRTNARISGIRSRRHAFAYVAWCFSIARCRARTSVAETLFAMVSLRAKCLSRGSSTNRCSETQIKYALTCMQCINVHVTIQ